MSDKQLIWKRKAWWSAKWNAFDPTTFERVGYIYPSDEGGVIAVMEYPRRGLVHLVDTDAAKRYVEARYNASPEIK